MFIKVTNGVYFYAKEKLTALKARNVLEVDQ